MQNAVGWRQRLTASFPLYQDLLQPVQLAAMELCTGLATLQHAAAASQRSASGRITASAVALMTPPELREGETIALHHRVSPTALGLRRQTK